MQNTTKKNKRAAIICAAVFVALMLGYLAIFAFALLSEQVGSTAIIVMVLLYSALIAAAVIGVLAALRQRMKELDSGEEEEAKKY